jgi:hypothetical protein
MCLFGVNLYNGHSLHVSIPLDRPNFLPSIVLLTFLDDPLPIAFPAVAALRIQLDSVTNST